MHALKVRNVSKRFGAVEVLRDISLEVGPGEFLVLVGPSGCGKSTLLNCLAGLETVTSGEIWLGDRRIDGVAPKDRDIAMVFQSYALYPNMDVRGNIAFGMEMRKVPKADQDRRIAEVAQMLQIEHLLDRKPGQLSGGQRQRVAMGRALARNPSMFLFDEPLSNLDAKLRVEMRAEIKQLHQRARVTSVYVTHDQVEAMTLGSKICIMKDGVIQQFGTPKQLYQTPANLFVAGFVGSPSMNILPVTPSFSGDRLSVALESGEGQINVEMPALNEARAFAGKPLLLGIRPEAVTRAAPGKPGLRAKVDIVEPTGPDIWITARANGKSFQARLAPQDDVNPGDMVDLSIAADQALLFEPESGRRFLS